MKRLLLTGFEKFLSFSSNPSEEIAFELNQKKVGSYHCSSVILPVDFENSSKVLLETLDQGDFDAILSLGLAFSREEVSLERVAINLIDDAARKDNSGRYIEDQKILENAENAYFSTLPLKKLQKILREENFKTEISLSAGSYVCNLVMFQLLHFLNLKNKVCPAGFIHLPPDKKLKAESEWSLDRLKKCIEVIIENL
ncbi:MAG: peptidase C15 [Bdellovibrionota bacterium]|nr:peptidase C15 [Bdellovibrionota bacterium]